MKEYMKKYIKNYAFIIILALILTSALLVDGIPSGHDINAHLARTVGMSKEISEGQFPPLVVSNYANGFGYSWNLFYPPLAPYLMAVFQLFVGSYVNALKVLIMLCMVIAGLAMFKLIEDITENKNVSLLGSIIYMCSPYIITDIFIRMAVGEILAYAFLPVLFLGIHNLFQKDGRKYPFIVVGAVGILLSHNISTVFAVGLSVIYVLFNINKLNNFKIWKKIEICCLFIILIVGFFYFPMLQAQNASDYKAFTYGKMATVETMHLHSLYLSQVLFGGLQGGASDLLTTPSNVNRDMCMQIGLFIIVPVLFTPFVYKHIEKKNRKNYILTLVVGLLAIFATTTLCPYDKLPEQFSIIQFPWRFLFVATFTLSIIATINIAKIFENLSKKHVMILAIIIISYISPLIFANTFTTALTDEIYMGTDIVQGGNYPQSNCTAGLEYLPSKAYDNIEYLVNREQNVVIMEGNITIQEENKNGSYMTIKFNNESEKSIIELPYVYYPGYDIRINGEKIDYYESQNGFIVMDVPENQSGEITVKYTGTRLARLTWIISLLTVIVFIVFNIIRFVKHNKEIKKLDNAEKESIE